LARSYIVALILGVGTSAAFAAALPADESAVDPAEALRILEQVQGACQRGLPNDTAVRRECSYTPAREYSFWSQRAGIGSVLSDSKVRRDGARWRVTSTTQLRSTEGATTPWDFEQTAFWDGNRLARWQTCGDATEKAAGELTRNPKRKDDLRKEPLLGYELDGILTHRDFEDIGHLMIRKKGAESARLVSKQGEEPLYRFEASSGLWNITLWLEANPTHAIRKIESVAKFTPKEDFRYAKRWETVVITKAALVGDVAVAAEGTVETVRVLRTRQRASNESLLGWLWNTCLVSTKEQARVSIKRTIPAEPSDSVPADAFQVASADGIVFHCPDEPPRDYLWSGSDFVPSDGRLPGEERLHRGVRELWTSPTGPGALETGWQASIPWVGTSVGCVVLAWAIWARYRRKHAPPAVAQPIGQSPS
jgi:hypothetical protein